MPVYKAFEIAAQIYPLGDFDLFSGDYKTQGGLVHVGPLEGDAAETAPYQTAEITADQYTGATPHYVTVTPGKIELTFGVIGGVAGVMAKIAATGSAHVGGNRRRKVTETSAWLVPRALFDAFPAGFNYDGATWTPSGVPTDPNMEQTAFFPRCYFRTNGVPRPYSNAGKSVVPVVLTALYDSTGLADKNILVRGNPVTNGYPLFRL